jgi:hypothetical protein
MPVYVVEIEGAGIAAFRADNGSDAERFVGDRLFRDDLMVLATDCRPLWDGVAEIKVREARADEQSRWRASLPKAVRHGNIEGDKEPWVAFLVALTDLTRRKR